LAYKEWSAWDGAFCEASSCFSRKEAGKSKAILSRHNQETTATCIREKMGTDANRRKPLVGSLAIDS